MLLKALFIGMRFDLRLAVLLSLIHIVLSLLPYVNISNSIWIKQLSKFYNYIVIIILLLFYSVDFGHYSYLGRRVDVSVLRFLENPVISLRMIWESYPVIIILFFLILVFIGFIYLFRLSYSILTTNRKILLLKNKIYLIAISFLIIIFSLWGTFKQYPLRWSDAFFSNNPFISALGLNPLLYYNDTRRFAKDDYNMDKTQHYYPLLTNYFSINNPDSINMNYSRSFSNTISKNEEPNVVIIFLESVGANRLTALGNPLNATPNLDRIIENGILFNRFYVPFIGTARSVFTMVTGIPDVARIKTSSRNPRINRQYSIINNFNDYEKHYIMGGSAGWANIRGFLQLNIHDLSITELDDLNSPRLDVWGVSDHDLFKESHQIFENLNTENPFFAIIQTATNHRPYSIPKNIDGFQIENLSKEQVNIAGFNSVDQYNAMRLLDHALGEYFSYVKNSNYYDNTIFFLFGDHGTSDPWAKHMPLTDYELMLRSYHVPLIVYGNRLKEKGVIRDNVSMLPDLMPTIAGFAGINYHNQTLGHDLMSLKDDQNSYALTVGKDRAYPVIGLVGKQYYLTMYHDGTNINLYDLYSSGSTRDVKLDHPNLTIEYSRLVRGLYETSKYMLYHNSELLKP
ncbi:LTA synthase family protein [Candidatus Marinimicrobia bacterium]|nr:LTA synthase family protein [Candidatus Neomarinimicrobiota bacterium]